MQAPRLVAPVAALALLIAGRAGAGEVEVRRDARELGFCAWVRGQAASEAVLMQSPELFARFGLLNAGEVADSALPLGSNALRLTVGLNYSGSMLYRGLTLRERAEAECERHLSRSTLTRMLEGGDEVGEREALGARAAMLESLLPQAAARVSTLEQEVERGQATVEELHALQMRMDSLRRLAHQTQVEREALPEVDVPAQATLPTLMTGFAAADGRVERLSAALRQARAWDVSVVAGYDQIFGLSQGVPVIAFVTATFNPGYFWQPAADARAQEGRQAFLGDDQRQGDAQLQALVGRLRSTLEAERKRLDEVRVLTRDLAAQLASLEQLQTERVRRFRNTVWFELAHLRAEEAYLGTHIEALGAFVEGSSP